MTSTLVNPLALGAIYIKILSNNEIDVSSILIVTLIVITICYSILL